MRVFEVVMPVDQFTQRQRYQNARWRGLMGVAEFYSTKSSRSSCPYMAATLPAFTMLDSMHEAAGLGDV